MITLITAVPGNGKTHKAIDLLLQCISDNEKLIKKGLDPRPIFCDIAGINSPDRTPLPSVEPIPKQPMYFGADDEEFQKVLKETNNTKDHYWLPPEGSIFFFDECQRVDWIKNSHGTLSKDVRTRSLETHRHRGLDFYFIAQGANYIHNHIQDLIGRHYHLERPLNMPFANVFMHNAFVSRPQTKSAKKGADDHTVLKLSKKLGQYYKSSSQHNMKTTIPKKIIGIVVLALVFGIYAFSRLNADDGLIKRTQSDETPTAPATPDQPQPQPNQSTQPTGYHYKYVDYTDNEDMRPAMIIRTSTTCYARNSRGVPLDLDIDTCNFYSDNQQFIPRASIPEPKEEDQRFDNPVTGDPV